MAAYRDRGIVRGGDRGGGALAWIACAGRHHHGISGTGGVPAAGGAPAVPVALGASAAILFVVICLAHGVSLRTSAALLGTLTSLLLAALLSWAAIALAHPTGLSEEQHNEVAAYLGGLSITGLLLAGFIIGALGVLNDVTVTQASTAFELAKLGDGDSRRAILV